MKMKMKRFSVFVLLILAFVGGNLFLGISFHATNTVKHPDPAYTSVGLNDSKLKERRYSFTNRKTLENGRTDDYQPVDPSPSSKATIGAGPIEHGTPLLPYVPRYTPPPSHPKDMPPVESPASIEHGTPLLPYVSRYTPPPGHPKDMPPVESPASPVTN